MAETPEHDGQVVEDGLQRVELMLPARLYQQALALAAEQGWPEQEALLTVLSHGLAYLQGECELSRLNRGEPDLRAEAERWRQRAMELEGAYAVMKFRAWERGEHLKTLELNVSGLRGENELARSRLATFRADEARLKAELAALREQHAALQAQVAAAPPAEPRPEPAPRVSLLGRLVRWLRGGASAPLPSRQSTVDSSQSKGG
ncbi:MAG: hypothetical protein HY690_08615 [Chloroflexi bacterium]|nr:hypothetical protein [Chloroflexota bacterium]